MTVATTVAKVLAPKPPRTAAGGVVAPVRTASVCTPEPEVVLTAVAEQEVPVVIEKPEPKFQLLDSETFALTCEKALEAAREHLALPQSPTERMLDRRRTKELVARIKGGTWLPCNWATVLYEGVKYRMNGQHSSRAMLEAADYLPEVVGIHLDHYSVPDRESMALLFRQFDMRQSGRSTADVSGAYQGLVRELEGLSRSKCQKAIEGIAWFQRVVAKEYTPPNDGIYEMFFHPVYYPFLRWFDKFINSKTVELVFDGVVGAMRSTFIVSESGAQEFWPHVAKQDLHDDGDPRMALGKELLAILDSKKTDHPMKVTPSEYYCKCIKAWNAFRFGERVSNLKVVPKKGWPEVAD